MLAEILIISALFYYTTADLPLFPFQRTAFALDTSEPQDDIPHINYEELAKIVNTWTTGSAAVRTLEKREKNAYEDRLCRMVCEPCIKLMSTRYSALCWIQCQRGGRAFDACITLLSAIDNSRG